MTRRALRLAALLTACAAAVPAALLGLLWGLLLWSPAGLAVFCAALLGLAVFWRCAWLHARERDGRAP